MKEKPFTIAITPPKTPLAKGWKRLYIAIYCEGENIIMSLPIRKVGSPKQKEIEITRDKILNIFNL